MEKSVEWDMWLGKTGEAAGKLAQTAICSWQILSGVNELQIKDPNDEDELTIDGLYTELPLILTVRYAKYNRILVFCLV